MLIIIQDQQQPSLSQIFGQLLAGETRPLPLIILSQTSQVRIVITSRARLNVRGEHLLPVSGLTIPELGTAINDDHMARYSAITLFVQSAGRVNADFEINEANWPDVAHICRLVHGLPLGIELAATWMEVLSPAEIATEIENSLDFLTAEWSDIPDRQRSIRAVFNASWRLLSSEEQRALQRLSTFRGSFSRLAAEAVAAADLKMLLVLVNKSWLHRDPAGDYQIHELLRQYSQEKLKIDQVEYYSARMDHARYFATWLEGIGETIRGHGQKEALTDISSAFENIRLAWAWLVVEGEVAALTRQMLPALVRFCAVRTRGEDMLALVGAAQGAINAVEQNSADALILETARLAYANGFYAPPYFGSLNLGSFMPAEGSERVWLAFKKIDPRQVDALWPVLTCLIYPWISRQDRPATDRLRELIQIYQDEGKDWSLAFALKYLGQIESSPSAFYSDESLAKDIATKSLGIRRQETALVLKKAAAIFRRVGDQLELADSLRLLGIHHHFLEPQLALKPLLQAKRLFKEMGDLVMAAEISSTLAIRSIWLGDIEEGFAHYKEKRDIFEALGNRRYLAHAADNEALHALRHFGVDHARQLRHQSRKLFTELGLDSYLAWSLWEIGDLERVAGNLDLALDYYQRAHHLIEREDMPFARIFYARGMGDHAQAKGDSQAALNFFSESLHLSRELGHRWAAGYALCGLGRAYMGAGRLDKASRYFYQAVHQTQRIVQNDLTMIALVGLAKLKSVSGRPEQSIILATFVSHHRHTWLETKGQAKEIITDAAGHLPEETANAARQRGLTMTKEEILAMVYAEEGSEEE